MSFMRWKAPSRLADFYWFMVHSKVLLDDGYIESLDKYSCIKLVLLLLPVMFS